MRDKYPNWAEYLYEARHPTVNGVRGVFQKYFEAIRLGTVDAYQPDPAGVLDLEAADHAIAELIQEQLRNPGIAGVTSRPPCASMSYMPDAAKMAMWQEILEVFKTYGPVSENGY